MFDTSRNCWVETPLVPNYKEEYTVERENMKERFAAADRELANISSGYDSIDAIYHMEQLAREGCPEACFAMYELFHYGWAVKKDKKQALLWLKAAKKAGSAEAAALLKKRTLSRSLICLVALLAVAACFAAFWFFVLPHPEKKESGDSGSPSSSIKIVLPDGATEESATDAADYGNKIADLIGDYDTDAIKTGQESPARILLIYEGDTLDLSGYNVVSVLHHGTSFTLQFKTVKDAEDCLEYLNGLEGTVLAQFDGYQNSVSASRTSLSSATLTAHKTYHSSYTGFDYYTWGVEAMGYDEYSAYLQTILPSDHEISVAVIDSGVLPTEETEDRILDGYDPFVDDSYGKRDTIGHGTHVASTILDCTRGLNVYVTPYAVAEPGYGNISTAVICNAVEAAVENDDSVINMSLGGPSNDLTDKIERYYINKAIDAGVIVVVAAGNEEVDANTCSPAGFSECITVSAIDKKGKPAYFTNFGSCIDVCAPGVQILNYTVPESTDLYGEPELDYLDGTSMATPHISALVAMMQLEFDETPEMIDFYLKKYCKQMSGDPDYFGSGLPMASYFVEKE